MLPKKLLERTTGCHSLLALFEGRNKRNKHTFGGDVIVNRHHHYTFINQWNSHEARLLFALQAQSIKVKNMEVAF